MKADPKPKPHQGDRAGAERARRHQEEALDDALKNTFPASDPVSIQPPLPSGTDETGKRPRQCKRCSMAGSPPAIPAVRVSGFKLPETRDGIGADCRYR
jgi:hypothetical protein